MKWKRVRGKGGRDVIDVRGAPSSGAGGGGLGGLPIPGGVAGLGGGAGIVVVIVIIALQLFGGGSGLDVGSAFGPGAQAPGAEDPQPLPPGQDPQRELFEFSRYVFTDAQGTWERTFREQGDPYRDAQLVVYSDRVQTGGCGGASSAVGPFYCPADQRVYLDLTFYEDMRRVLRAPGDFAWAYVIAHEIGHHVQRVSGTEAEVRRAEASDPDRANDLSVRLELQADCYAGVWAATVYREGRLEGGDLDEAFIAAEAVGDDRLQARAGGSVDPDTFTHGSSAQRRHWFEQGYGSGDPAACDTFSVDEV